MTAVPRWRPSPPTILAFSLQQLGINATSTTLSGVTATSTSLSGVTATSTSLSEVSPTLPAINGTYLESVLRCLAVDGSCAVLESVLGYEPDSITHRLAACLWTSSAACWRCRSTAGLRRRRAATRWCRWDRGTWWRARRRQAACTSCRRCTSPSCTRVWRSPSTPTPTPRSAPPSGTAAPSPTATASRAAGLSAYAYYHNAMDPGVQRGVRRAG